MNKEKCKKCGHEWYKRLPGTPVRCPECGCRYYGKGARKT